MGIVEYFRRFSIKLPTLIKWEVLFRGTDWVKVDIENNFICTMKRIILEL